ncbi:MAG: PHP domain-containing protein, partial [Rectinemataceae bacterium]
MFSQLQVHSSYSLLYGVRGMEELVSRAKELGYDRLALTDIDSLYGVHAFIEAASKAGIRPIIGAELHDTEGRLVALVRNREGFANLCELLSLFSTERHEGRVFSLAKAFAGDNARRSAGLVLASDVPTALAALAGRVERLYATVTPRSLRGVSTAGRLGLPLLALGDVTFLEAGDRDVHRVLRAIALNTTLGRLDEADCEPPGALLFGPEEAERF